MNEPYPPSTTGLVDAMPLAPPPAPEAYAAVVPPRLTWHDRLAQWRSLRGLPLHLEDDRTLAARGAEREAKRRISAHHATQYGHVLSNKRIPRDVTAKAMGRYEADLIAITTRRVIVLEVKNWSGQLRAEGSDWVQTQRSGNQVWHANPLTHNREKLRALYRYLRRSGVMISPERFQQALVFANPRLTMDPMIAAHPAVHRLDNVGCVLGEPTSAARHVAARLIQLLSSAETSASLAEHLLRVIPPADVRRAAEAVGALRTWDRLTLYGGKELQGDILWARIGGRRLPGSALRPSGIGVLTWRRSLGAGIIWVALDKGPGYVDGDMLRGTGITAASGRIALQGEDCLYFHEVGAPMPMLVMLVHVERIAIG